MAKIKVVTDSTIDLTLEEAEKYGIEMIPLCINIDNETYLDRVELTPTDFIEKMKKNMCQTNYDFSKKKRKKKIQRVSNIYYYFLNINEIFYATHNLINDLIWL